MRLSITVLCTLALALVAQGIPVPNPTGSDDGHTTPPPHPPSHPSTPPHPQPPQQHQPAPNSPGVPPHYSRRTSDVHTGSVGWVAPDRYSPPAGNPTPHPFIADHTPSPGGTVHGFGATHGIIGDGRNNRDANRYVTDHQHGSFQPNAEGHPTNINVHNRQRTNSGHFYDSTDHRLPSHITPQGMEQLRQDHRDSQRGSTSRPRVSMRGLAMAVRGMGTGGRGRGNQPESSRGRTSTRGNRGGGNAESSRSSSRGSRRGASADRKGQHRKDPY